MPKNVLWIKWTLPFHDNWNKRLNYALLLRGCCLSQSSQNLRFEESFLISTYVGCEGGISNSCQTGVLHRHYIIKWWGWGWFRLPPCSMVFKRTRLDARDCLTGEAGRLLFQMILILHFLWVRLKTSQFFLYISFRLHKLLIYTQKL